MASVWYVEPPPRKKEKWNPLKNHAAPQRWSRPRTCEVLVDIFAPSVSFRKIDLVMAAMASEGPHQFKIQTAYPNRADKYMARVKRLSAGAAEKYERRMRAHFRRYKMRFKEGYSLPERPTPELRFIYDSAAVQENRPRKPNGTTLRCGFSGGEFHWRKWPLDNVAIVTSRPVEGPAGEAKGEK